jgi:hypothetical protein
MRNAMIVAGVLAIIGVAGAAGADLVGTTLPEFTDAIQFDPSGPAVKLADLRGKGVLLIFHEPGG